MFLQRFGVHAHAKLDFQDPPWTHLRHSNLVRASPRTPPRHPGDTPCAPRTSQDAPHGSQGCLGTPKIGKVDHRKTLEIYTFGLQGQRKTSFLHFCTAPGTSQEAPPFGRTRPRASQGPIHTSPGVSESPLGPKSIPQD